MVMRSCRRAAYALGFATAMAASASVAGDGYGQAASRWVVTAEGGLACMTGDGIVFGSGEKRADRGCGWTGALSVGQVRTPMLWGFDAWTLGVRQFDA